MIWRHVIISTRCVWLHGDARGFRSRGHRIHSSGDYKNPPPRGEHAGLWRYHKARSSDPVKIGGPDRATSVRSFVLKLREQEIRVIAVSMGATHLHALVELPVNPKLTRLIIGRAKQASSHAVKTVARIWAEGGKFDVIRDKAHLHNAYHYIRTKQERGAVVWSHREDENWIDFAVPVKVM